LASDLNTLLAASLGAGGTKYDPETQMRPQGVSAAWAGLAIGGWALRESVLKQGRCLTVT